MTLIFWKGRLLLMLSGAKQDASRALGSGRQRLPAKGERVTSEYFSCSLRKDTLRQIGAGKVAACRIPDATRGGTIHQHSAV
jgi:hypothetical protein